MKISVVIPLYNKKETVNRALQSVINQTTKPEEIIVVNDGSTDGSERIVEKIKHPLIKLINQSNNGVSSARNIGIEEAKGDWIAFLDADDQWMPEYLETIKQLFTTCPTCSVAATAYLLEDHAGKQKDILLNKIQFQGERGIMSNYFEVAYQSHPPLWTSAVAVKKEAIQAIGGFPAGVISGEDLLTWARLAAQFEIAYSKKPLSVFIQCKAHTYSDKPNRIPQEPDMVGDQLLRLARRYKEARGIKKYVAHWFKMRSSIYLRIGMKKNAMISAINSLLYNPLNFKVYVYLILLLLPKAYINRVFRKLGNE